MLHDVVIAVGSNIDPSRNVPRALAELESLLANCAQAQTYRTEAIGRPDQPNYWNTAVRGTTIFGPRTLKAALRRIEANLGRVRTQDKYAARTIDLDEIWRDGKTTDADVAKRSFLQSCLCDLGINLAKPPPIETP